ncbi:hypothetical protein DPMN_078756 [Dreissena polymorpha]|uniref:Uncharacterized protein n=1 Tax=Dreissena polymorpha TaxID=45954 RepID=A0A9D4BQJ5_DREPO|nr:hypothetical protein DPMN_078756 [Dreissena polymorpha]
MNLTEKKLNYMSKEKPLLDATESRREHRTSDQPNYRRGHIGLYVNMIRGRGYRSYRGQYPNRGYYDKIQQNNNLDHLTHNILTNKRSDRCG